MHFFECLLYVCATSELMDIADVATTTAPPPSPALVTDAWAVVSARRIPTASGNIAGVDGLTRSPNARTPNVDNDVPTGHTSPYRKPLNSL